MIEQYWSWWWGGLAIAAVAIAMTLITGKWLGITRGYVAACSLISKKSYFTDPTLGGTFGFRTFFIIGVVIGGFLAALYTGGWEVSTQKGLFYLGQFDAIFGNSLWVKALVLISGGILWGFGSRMAGGCTSGNSISGLSKGSLASLIATIGFMIAGIIVTYGLNYFTGNL